LPQFSKLLSIHTSYKANTFLLKIQRRWNFYPRQDLKNMFLKSVHYNLAISEVSHYGFWRVHSSISELRDQTVGFNRGIQKIKKNE
jgi:hypothetical protein